MAYVTFGRFGKEEQWKRDKEVFLDELRNLISELTKNEELYAKANEIEIVKALKPIIAKKCYDGFWFDEALIDFMLDLGLSYEILTKKEKKEIYEMEFTYDNWKKKSEILYNNYLMKCKKNCPKRIDFCLNYRLFVIYVLSNFQCELTLNNFLRFIRNFFILERGICFYENYMDLEEFNRLKNKVIEIYPELKEMYGANRTLEKNFLYLFDEDNDYNYEIMRNILDNYYNKKKNNKIIDDEKIKLKDD